MDRQNVVYTYHGILFSHKKWWSSETYYYMDEPWNIMLSEISQAYKDRYYMIPIYEITRIGKYIEKERIVVAGSWGEGGMGSYY